MKKNQYNLMQKYKTFNKMNESNERMKMIMIRKKNTTKRI